jgi:hypothetical protein
MLANELQVVLANVLKIKIIGDRNLKFNSLKKKTKVLMGESFRLFLS